MNKDVVTKTVLLAVIAGLVVVMYHFQGNAVPSLSSRSAFVWMFARWQDSVSLGADYSFAWIVPLVSASAIWVRRKTLLTAPRQVAHAGLAIVVAALLLHVIGARIAQTRISLFSLIMLGLGLPYYFLGRAVARQLVFPCGYLVFCIPFNFLDSLTFPLRMMATTASSTLLNGLGIPVQQLGSSIHFTRQQGLILDVADPCSGLRSLIAMTALAAAYAFFTQATLIRKWLLFLMSIPIAILANVVRITTISIVASTFGEQRALALYHDYSGYLIFGAATLLVMGAGKGIELLAEKGSRLAHDIN